jgi:hypothetical protein
MLTGSGKTYPPDPPIYSAAIENRSIRREDL